MAPPLAKTPSTPRNDKVPTATGAVAVEAIPSAARRPAPVAPPSGFDGLAGLARAVYSAVALATRVAVAASAPATAVEYPPLA